MSANSGMDDDAVIKGIELRLDTLVSGLESALPAHVTELRVGDVTYKILDLIAKAKGLNHPWKAKRAARSVYRQARVNESRDRKAALELLADAKAALVALVGRKSATLVEFGFKPQATPRKRKRDGEKPDTNQSSVKTVS